MRYYSKPYNPANGEPKLGMNAPVAVAQNILDPAETYHGILQAYFRGKFLAGGDLQIFFRDNAPNNFVAIIPGHFPFRLKGLLADVWIYWFDEEQQQPIRTIVDCKIGNDIQSHDDAGHRQTELHFINRHMADYQTMEQQIEMAEIRLHQWGTAIPHAEEIE